VVGDKNAGKESSLVGGVQLEAFSKLDTDLRVEIRCNAYHATTRSGALGERKLLMQNPAGLGIASGEAFSHTAASMQQRARVRISSRRAPVMVIRGSRFLTRTARTLRFRMSSLGFFLCRRRRRQGLLAPMLLIKTVLLYRQTRSS